MPAESFGRRQALVILALDVVAVGLILAGAVVMTDSRAGVALTAAGTAVAWVLVPCVWWQSRTHRRRRGRSR